MYVLLFAPTHIKAPLFENSKWYNKIVMMNDWNISKSSAQSKEYECPYCENKVASKEYFYTSNNSGGDIGYIWICPHCHNATIFVKQRVSINGYQRLIEKMIPNNKIGKPDIKNLPDDIKYLWDEIRNSYQADAFDGVSMLIRTLLLMLCENLDENKTINKESTYKECVEYLIDNGHITKNLKKHAEELRKTANEFTHELQKVSKEKAKELINIVEFLLVTIYHYGNQK